MHLEEDENKDDIFGEEYKNYDLLPNLNISEFTGKNETVVENSPNKPIFERIEEKELQNLHHQTELSRDKDDKSNKEKLKIKKKKSFCDDSLKDSSNILNKKTNRDGDEKVKKKEKIKKRKSKMEITSKNYTEINNYEEIKKENDDTYPLNNEGNDIDKGKSGKKSCLIVIGVIVLLFIIGLLVNNEESEQNKDSNIADSIACVDSVEVELDIKSPEYVKKHLEEVLNQAKDESIERALTKYFSKDFIKLYNEVEEIDNRTLKSGELGFWDFDFWTGGQDGELQSVKVLEIKDMVGNSASAIVQYLIKFGDYDESKVSKEFQLLFESDEWRIDDFDNYKWRFKDYIDSSVSQQVEISDTIFADSVAVAE